MSYKGRSPNILQVSKMIFRQLFYVVMWLFNPIFYPFVHSLGGGAYWVNDSNEIENIYQQLK